MATPPDAGPGSGPDTGPDDGSDTVRRARADAALAHPSPPVPPGTAPPAAWRSGDLARAALIALGVWLGLQLLWSVNALVFAVFLGVLFGVGVASGVDRLARLGLGRGLSSALIVFGTVGAIALVGVLVSPTLAAQGRELRRDLPEALDKLQTLINQREFGFLDPFLRTPADSAPPVDADSAARADSVAAAARQDSILAARRRRVPPRAPTVATLDSATLAALSQAIEDSLLARTPRNRAPDSGLFEPAAPFARPADSSNDSTAAVRGVLGDTTTPVTDIDVAAGARGAHAVPARQPAHGDARERGRPPSDVPARSCWRAASCRHRASPPAARCSRAGCRRGSRAPPGSFSRSSRARSRCWAGWCW